jgi:hypothetical protein
MIMMKPGIGDGKSVVRARRRVGVAALAALVTLGGCGDVTGPSENSELETVVANGPALGGLISNESARVLPSVLPAGGRDELTASLEHLASALQAGLGGESRAAISRFTAVVDQYANATDNPDVAAELAALRHAVEVVREAVEAK